MDNDFGYVNDLYLRGDYSEALSLIEELPKDERLEIIRGMIFIHKSEYNLSSKILDELIEKSQSPEIRSKAIASKAFMFYRLGNYTDAENLLNSIDLTVIQADDILGDYFNLTGLVYQGLGKYKEAQYSFDKVLEIRKRNSDQLGLAVVYNNLGIVSRNQGNYKDAISYYEKCLTIDKETGNKANIANSLNNLGVVHNSIGEFQTAMNYYKEALELYEELGIDFDLALVKNNIGVVHGSLGDYKKAVEYITQSLEIRKSIKGYDYIRSNYFNLAMLHYQMSNYSEADKYLFALIKRLEDQPNDSELSEALLLLTKLYISTHRDPTAHIERLEKIAKQSALTSIMLSAKIARGLYLKSINNLDSLVRAQSIFKEVLSHSNLGFQMKVSSLFNLARLNLKEYLILNESDVLDEFTDILSELESLSRNSINPRLAIEVSMLYSNYSIIINDMVGYRKYLSNAKELITRYNLNFYTAKLSKFERRLEKEVENLKSLDIDGFQLRKRMRHSQLEDYLDQIINQFG